MTAIIPARATLLDDAADIIARDGLAVGRPVDGRGAVCALGAITKSAGLPPDAWRYLHWAICDPGSLGDRPELVEETMRAQAAFDAAAAFARHALGITVDMTHVAEARRELSKHVGTEWSDRAGHGAVMAALRKAAEAERARMPATGSAWMDGADT